MSLLPLVDLDLRQLRRGQTHVLGALNLRMAQGETLALVGPSGIGKTSLLRVIAGLETGIDGTCRVHGTVAMVFQEPTLLPWRSVMDNICLTTGVDPKTAAQALRDVGLEGRGADYPGQLSLGQQRRLALARAFAAQPDLLLLDEPFVSLDPDRAQEMMQLFRQLRDAHGVGTILVTHSTEEAQALADRIVTLGGSPATIVHEG